ncbi:AraC family transcriptional regulator [Chryseobacterium sp.]|uniref:helix-turn-helix domain-containing protein n=1 Tax=Chryseobacterium sp. TaxID=1871047 RepID=UPI0025B8FD6C|nr:AraC family transcriptional regulator [Chryseobacterium sp.]
MKNILISKETTTQIDELKKEFVMRYLILMSLILGFYTLAFYLATDSDFTTYYLLGGTISMIIIILIAWKQSFPGLANQVRVFLILAPLYDVYFIVDFFEMSLNNITWLLPIPLGAYVMLSRKDSVYYSIYAILIVIVAVFVSYNKGSEDGGLYRSFFNITEVSAYVFNGLIIWMLIHYKDKIKKIRDINEVEVGTEGGRREKMTVTLDKDKEQEYIDFFQRIDFQMREQMYFKDPKFSMSKLCIILDTNSSYLSKAIRAAGYSNFNIYLNILRIEYVKKLINESDLSRVTLMYIYTEGGFSNQPNFNRVFKRIEGVTPSEYIQNLT